MFPGLMKGTVLSGMTGTHTQTSYERVDLRVRRENGEPRYQSPLDVYWKWERDIVCLACDCRTIKVTPTVQFSTGTGDTYACDVRVGDILKGVDNTFVVEKMNIYRVLSPVYNMIFKEPVWLISKGVFVSSAFKYVKEVKDVKEEIQPVLSASGNQTEFFTN
jgi:hypothetical protein